MKIHLPIKSDNIPHNTRSKSSKETLEVLGKVIKLKPNQSLPVEMDDIKTAKSLYARMMFQFKRREMNIQMNRVKNVVYFTKI